MSGSTMDGNTASGIGGTDLRQHDVMQREALARAGLAMLVAVCVLLSVVWTSANAVAVTDEAPETVTFGCDGIMQVANVDCAHGTFDAFTPASHTTRNDATCNLTYGCDSGDDMAPVCDGALDMTRYGCIAESNPPRQPSGSTPMTELELAGSTGV